MLFSIRRKSNVIFAANALISHLKIKVTSFTQSKDLLAHPDYPSMLAISDCLTSWRVPNAAFRVKKDSSTLADLPHPHLAHLKTEGGQFVLVHDNNKAFVTVSTEYRNRFNMPVNDFIDQWDGIILIAEKKQESGEDGYYSSLINGIFSRLKFVAFVTVAITCLLWGLSGHDLTPVSVIYFLLFVSGTCVSMLLLAHSVNSANPFLTKLCSLGRNNNCNSILKSEAANVTSWLSWSEVGFFYFAGSLLTLVFVPASSELLKILSIAVVPFTIYSLWYQYSVGAWCTLCCIVQALLVIGALTAGLDGLHWWEIRADMTMVPSLLTYIFPVSVWALLKPLLLRAQQIEPLQQQVRKFKYNSKFFSQLLASQKHYAIPDEIMPVVLGSPDAATTITMVSNPFCGPCASAHKLLDKWLKERDDLQVKIVFATANHDDDDRTKVARHVTALSLLEDKSLAADAMNDWYSQAVKQFDEWSARFPVPQDKDITSVTTKQKEWCREAEIMFTPTIFVNGYKLVEPYELEDIRQLID
jgi:hypothetical protein